MVVRVVSKARHPAVVRVMSADAGDHVTTGCRRRDKTVAEDCCDTGFGPMNGNLWS